LSTIHCFFFAKIRIALPVGFHGLETLSLTLRVEHGLRVFENSVLRIFVPKIHEMAGGWRKMHNKTYGER
jgi:hypothetical protein